MFKHTAILLSSVGIASGCTATSIGDSPSGGGGQQAVESNVAGIATVDVIEPTQSGVTIVGLDGSGTQVARLQLFRGDVTFVPDGELEPVTTDGRSLTVRVLQEAEFEHVSAGQGELTLPMTQSLPTAAFLRLSPVASALRPYGMQFQALGIVAEADPVDGEVAYEEEAVYGSRPCEDTPWSGCAAGGTTAVGYRPYSTGAPYEWRCCGNGTFNERMCPGANQWSSCGQTGNGGCAVCWSSSWNEYCAVDYYDAQGRCRAWWYDSNGQPGGFCEQTEDCPDGLGCYCSDNQCLCTG